MLKMQQTITTVWYSTLGEMRLHTKQLEETPGIKVYSNGIDDWGFYVQYITVERWKKEDEV